MIAAFTRCYHILLYTRHMLLLLLYSLQGQTSEQRHTHTHTHTDMHACLHAHTHTHTGSISSLLRQSPSAFSILQNSLSASSATLTAWILFNSKIWWWFQHRYPNSEMCMCGVTFQRFTWMTWLYVCGCLCMCVCCFGQWLMEWLDWCETKINYGAKCWISVVCLLWVSNLHTDLRICVNKALIYKITVLSQHRHRLNANLLVTLDTRKNWVP